MKRFYKIQSSADSYIQLMNIIGDNVFVINDAGIEDRVIIIIQVDHVVDLHNLLVRLYGDAYEFSGYGEADALWLCDAALPEDSADFGEFIERVVRKPVSKSSKSPTMLSGF